jgi:hypothetical protein
MVALAGWIAASSSPHPAAMAAHTASPVNI